MDKTVNRNKSYRACLNAHAVVTLTKTYHLKVCYMNTIMQVQ